MSDGLPQYEIEVLKGQIAALTHCLSLALILLDAQGDGAVLEWLQRANVIPENDFRREGATDVLERLRHLVERPLHDGDI